MIAETIGLIEPEQLLNQINELDLVILDGSMQKTVSGLNDDFGKSFMKGAYKFGFENTFCDSSSRLPHINSLRSGLRQMPDLEDRRGHSISRRSWASVAARPFCKLILILKWHLYMI